MRAKTLLSLLTLFFVRYAFAQDSIPNPGFENWVSSGKPAPFDWIQPVGWTSSNGATEFIAAGVNKIKLTGTSTFQAQLRTVNPFGNPKAGVLVSGIATVSSTFDESVDFLSGGIPYTTVKSKLYGSYLYNSSAAGDSAFVRVLFKKYNTTLGKADTIAYGEKALRKDSLALVPFEVNVNTINAGAPDSVIIGLYSSKPTNQMDGGTLVVDYVSFTAPSSVPESVKPIFGLYPNPASSTVTIQSESAFDYTVSDMLGREMLKGSSALPAATLDISGLKQGNYIVRLLTNKGAAVQKLTINN